MEDTQPDELTAKKRSAIYVLAIQVIFGVVIGVSLTGYHKELVPFSWDFEAAMILVTFSVVFASLIGYTIAIKARYHKNFIRFALDIILLYLYFQLIYSPQSSFEYFLGIFPWIFGLYVIWQFFEYREWKGSLWKKFSYGLPFWGAFLGIYIYYKIFSSLAIQKISDEVSRLDYEPVGNAEWWILGILFFLTIGFRIASYLIKH